LNIGVLVEDISKFTGLDGIMVQFADCFKELGYHVKIVTEFKRCEIKLKRDLFRFHSVECLEWKDLKFYHNIGSGSIPPVYMYDLLMVPHPIFVFQVKVPVLVYWFYGSAIYGSGDVFYWCDSEARKKRLDPADLFKAKVVYPPYNYSMFRTKKSHERSMDVVVCGRFEDFPRFRDFAKMCYKNKIVGAVVSTVKEDRHREILEELSYNYGVRCFYNLAPEELAEVMGKSRAYLDFFREEGFSVYLAQAMNAGCIPVVRMTEASKEEVGDCGVYFWTLDDIDWSSILSKSRNTCDSRGKFFDRSNIKKIISKCLEEISDEF